MDKFRKNTETMFENFTRWIFHNRFKTLIFVFAVVGAIASNMPNITIDTDTESFLHEDDPVRVGYNDFRDQFGRDELIVIAVNPKDVFDIGFLKKLQKFHKELEEDLPHLDEVTSLINARNTRGEEDALIVEDLLEDFPKSDSDLRTLKERVLTNPTYKNTMISEDGTFTTVVVKTVTYSSTGEEGGIDEGFDDSSVASSDATATEREFLSGEENMEVVTAVREIIAKYDGVDFPVTLAGSPVFTNDLKSTMVKDMQKFMKLALLIISIVLYLLFRRKSGVAIPLTVVALALFTTLGMMAAMGASIMAPTQILPSFILAVGVGASVHVLALFFKEFDLTGSKENAVIYALGHSGIPIVMTSLTTAIGLASFSTAEVAPIADLGIYASFGVMVSLFLTIILIPALVSILPMRRKEPSEKSNRHAKMDGVLTGIANFATGNSKLVITVCGVIIVAALFSISKLNFSHNPMTWLPEDMDIRKATVKIDKNLKGSTTLEVILDTGKENGLYDPEILNKVEKVTSELETIERGNLFVGKILSLADILKEIHQALNENRKDFYAIPQDRALIAQELLLFENSGSDDLETFVDSQFSMMRITIKLPWIDALEYGAFTYEVEQQFNNSLEGIAEVRVTGLVSLLGRTVVAAINSMAKSYVIAFGMITVMMIILVGNIRIGLISMIPNLFPIFIALGVMVPLGIPLDMFTMLIGSIAIGLAVDDTVHFMHNFRKYYHETGDVDESVRKTLTTAGRAMFVTTVVLTAGFFIFLFADMNNLINFGLLTGLAIIMALVADFLLAPALMKVINHPGAGYEEENSVTA